MKRFEIWLYINPFSFWKEYKNYGGKTFAIELFSILGVHSIYFLK